MTLPDRVREFIAGPRQSFIRRTLISNAIIAALVIVSLSVLFLIVVRKTFQAQFLLRGQEMAAFYAFQIQYPLLIADDAALARIAQTMLETEDVLFVQIVDDTGEHRVAMHRPPIALDPSDEQQGSFEKARTLNGESILDVKRPVKSPAQKGMFDWDPTRPVGSLGTVRVGFSMRKQTRLLHDVIGYAAAVTAFLLIVVVPGQGWELKRLLAPLGDLIHFSRAVGAGDLSIRAAVTRRDEIGELMLAFNQMLDQLSSTTVSRDYVDAVLQSMAECLFVIAPDGTIQTVNQAALAMLGYEAGDLIGRDASVVRPFAPSVSPVATSIHAGEDVFRSADGREIPVLFSSSPLIASGQTAPGTIWVALDVTEMHRAQQDLVAAKEEAEAANRAKSSFLAAMSHELRTPLNAILGFAQIIEMEMADQSINAWNDDLGRITRAGNHLLALINEILDLSKIDAGKMQVVIETFDPIQLASEVADELKPAAAVNDNRLDFRASPDLSPAIRAVADRMRTRQCLVNLVGNACKFTANGSVRIEPRCQQQGDTISLCFDIIDTGIGIAPRDVGQLFREFAQVDASTTRKYGGTGLGLAVSRKLARLMGGEITVISQPGQGSTFTLHIPALIELIPPEAASLDDCELAMAGSGDGCRRGVL